MKRLLFPCLVAIILASCTTTIKLTPDSPQPVRRGWMAVAWIVPGLPQVLNKEYLKALIVGPATIAATGIVAYESNQSPNLDTLGGICGVLAISGYTYGAIEGSNAARDLNNQYFTFHPLPAKLKPSTVTIIPEKEIVGLTLSLVPSYDGDDGYKGFTLSIDNKSDNLIRVLWAKSSVINGNHSSPIFIGDQKFIDAGKPVLDTAIPSSMKISKNIFASSQISFKRENWNITDIPYNPLVFVICVQANGIEDNYTIKLD
jgi:hypothetical protein